MVRHSVALDAAEALQSVSRSQRERDCVNLVGVRLQTGCISAAPRVLGHRSVMKISKCVRLTQSTAGIVTECHSTEMVLGWLL